MVDIDEWTAFMTRVYESSPEMGFMLLRYYGRRLELRSAERAWIALADELFAGFDADGDGTAPFAINAGTGVITLADSDDLDYETTTSYNLVVQATDTNTADTETITITVTDVAPTVTDTSANMAETAATGATVVDVDNTGDDDIAGLTWSITSGNTGNAFAIGAALAIAITVGGPISGGSFNPAVTIMLAAAKKLPTKEVVPYILAEIAGGLAALELYRRV